MNTSHFSRREDIRKVTLDDGVTLLTQCVPDALSVSIGAWVRCGSRDEGAQQHGKQQIQTCPATHARRRRWRNQNPRPR